MVTEAAIPEYPHKAKDRIEALIRSLRTMVERDPDQEVRGIAVPALDAVLEEVKSHAGSDPVVAAIAGVISPDTIDAGEPVRAVDALLVAEQLDVAIGNRPPPIPVSVQDRPSWMTQGF